VEGGWCPKLRGEFFGRELDVRVFILKSIWCRSVYSENGGIWPRKERRVSETSYRFKFPSDAATTCRLCELQEKRNPPFPSTISEAGSEGAEVSMDGGELKDAARGRKREAAFFWRKKGGENDSSLSRLCEAEEQNFIAIHVG